MSATFRHRAHCEVCEAETHFVADGNEMPWCEGCGHNDQTLNPTPQPGGCALHPDAGHHPGFGLAGGGYGAYSVCAECGAVFDKVQEPDDE